MNLETHSSPESADRAQLVKFLTLSNSRVLSEQTDSNWGEREKIAKITQNALTKSIDVVGADFEEFKRSVGVFTSQFEGTAEDFVSSLAEQVATFFLETSSLDDIAKKMRKNTLERNGLISVGEMFCYRRVDTATISLHITPMFFDNPMEFRRILNSELKQMADDLAMSESLAEVSSISISSPIVERMKKYLERLGFEGFQHDTQTGITKAIATKESFISSVQEELSR